MRARASFDFSGAEQSCGVVQGLELLAAAAGTSVGALGDGGGSGSLDALAMDPATGSEAGVGELALEQAPSAASKKSAGHTARIQQLAAW